VARGAALMLGSSPDPVMLDAIADQPWEIETIAFMLKCAEAEAKFKSRQQAAWKPI